MKINAIGVFTSNLKRTVDFYSLIGFKFPGFKPSEQHLEAITEPGGIRLMIDSKELIKSLIGEEPRPGNCSAFAIECSSVEELNRTAKEIVEAGFKIYKEPWDAFWGQRYCVIEDPDGHRIDLYASLSQ